MAMPAIFSHPATIRRPGSSWARPSQRAPGVVVPCGNTLARFASSQANSEHAVPAARAPRASGICRSTFLGSGLRPGSRGLVFPDVFGKSSMTKSQNKRSLNGCGRGDLTIPALVSASAQPPPSPLKNHRINAAAARDATRFLSGRRGSLPCERSYSCGNLRICMFTGVQGPFILNFCHYVFVEFVSFLFSGFRATLGPCL